jgi:hypothetical protein
VGEQRNEQRIENLVASIKTRDTGISSVLPSGRPFDTLRQAQGKRSGTSWPYFFLDKKVAKNQGCIAFP